MRFRRSPEMEIAAVASKGQTVVLRVSYEDIGHIDRIKAKLERLNEYCGVTFVLLDERIEVARVEDGPTPPGPNRVIR